jgi:cell division protein FtsW
MKLARTDRSRFTEWWFTIDHALLGAILTLVAAGLVLSLAASPPVAIKKGFSTYHFVLRHAVFATAGTLVMIAVSLLTPQTVRRVSLVILLATMSMLVAVLVLGNEINGSRRWLHLGGYSLQPSELAKPAFAVIMAWLFAEAGKRPDMPALPLACIGYAGFVALLLWQPDIGQSLLISVVWGALFIASGQSLRWAAVILGSALAVVIGAAASLRYVRLRIHRFIDPSSGDTFQTDRALQSFIDGGFFGRGPGEGTIKHILPDAHTDFILAVIGEEYGIIACLLLLGLFVFVTFRALRRSADDADPFVRLAVLGLVLLFAVQTLINMGVNIGLLPAKGMTLPFISVGGSSTLGMAVGMGFVLALTRRRPDSVRVKLPPLSAREGDVIMDLPAERPGMH